MFLHDIKWTSCTLSMPLATKISYPHFDQTMGYRCSPSQNFTVLLLWVYNNFIQPTLPFRRGDLHFIPDYGRSAGL